MTYALLDDGFYDSPTFINVPDDLVGVWAKGLAYCNKHLTDGLIPRSKVRSLCTTVDPDTVVSRMQNAGLWREKGDEIEHVGFLDHNPSKREVLSRRKATRERKDNWKRGKRNASPERVPETNTERVLGTLPDPIRSDPIRSDPKEEEEREPPSSDPIAAELRVAPMFATLDHGHLRREAAKVEMTGVSVAEIAQATRDYVAKATGVVTDPAKVQSGLLGFWASIKKRRERKPFGPQRPSEPEVAPPYHREWRPPEDEVRPAKGAA
jgi:hypothetical protein